MDFESESKLKDMVVLRVVATLYEEDKSHS